MALVGKQRGRKLKLGIQGTVGGPKLVFSAPSASRACAGRSTTAFCQHKNLQVLEPFVYGRQRERNLTSKEPIKTMNRCTLSRTSKALARGRKVRATGPDSACADPELLAAHQGENNEMPPAAARRSSLTIFLIFVLRR